MNYITIASEGRFEEDIKKSRFICHLKRIRTEDEARDFIQDIKKKHHKANHNCSAFILGERSQIKRSSDDGEPSGTAGVPMLACLEKLHLTNVVAVVTRYFGGIKLGSGGLIRAYSGNVSHAVEAIGRVDVKEQQGIHLTLSYAQYQDLGAFLNRYQLVENGTLFSTDVQTEVFVDQTETSAIVSSLTEFFHGKARFELSDIRAVEVPLI